jgi:hypothetical protein
LKLTSAKSKVSVVLFAFTIVIGTSVFKVKLAVVTSPFVPSTSSTFAPSSEDRVVPSNALFFISQSVLADSAVASCKFLSPLLR